MSHIIHMCSGPAILQSNIINMHSDLRPESFQWLFKSPLAGGGSILWWEHYMQHSLLELKMMEVVLTTAAIRHTKLQSIHHHQQPTPGFLQAGCPSCHPTNSINALNEKYHITRTFSPKLHWGLLMLSFTIILLLPWGSVCCQASHQPYDTISLICTKVNMKHMFSSSHIRCCHENVNSTEESVLPTSTQKVTCKNYTFTSHIHPSTCC